MRNQILAWAFVVPTVLLSACKMLDVPYVPGGGGGTGNGGSGHVPGAGGDSWHVPSGGGESYASGASQGYGGEHPEEPELVLGADFPIVGIGVVDEYLYWLTEGNVPSGGSYPGSLFRMNVSGSYIEVAAATLEEPTRLEMTAAAAYIWGKSPTVAYNGFLEFELGTTNYQPTDVGGSAPTLFAAFGDLAYVSHDLGANSGVFEHRIGEESRQVIWGMPRSISADETHIYFTTTDDELYRAPLDNPTSTELLLSDVSEDFALWQDQVLLLREDQLSALPKSGGALVDRLALEPGLPYVELRVADDRYFASRYEEDEGYLTVYTGLVSRGDCDWVYTIHSEDVWLGLPDWFYNTTGTYIQRKPLD